MKSKLVGAGLIAGATWVTYNRLREPTPLVKSLDVEKDHRGRSLVDEFLRVKGSSGIYAVGDCTSIDYDGPPVPALAQALLEHETLDEEEILEVTGLPPAPPLDNRKIPVPDADSRA